MNSLDGFAYDVPAELYSTSGVGRSRRPMEYRRFERSADAIRFAIEELPPLVQKGTVMEVADVRLEMDDIRKLYDSPSYPLARNTLEADGV